MISIVIPLFNEEENISALYERLISSSATWDSPFEIIFVDDGSTDSTAERILVISERDNHIRLLRLSRNFGHQAAISAGISRAEGAAVIIMDGDLQDPPEELSRFLAKWREGYDVVYAIRTKRKESFLKRCAYSAFYRLLSCISSIDIPLDSGDFCVMDRKVVDAIVNQMPENIRFVRGLRAYAGFRQVGVEYERDSRAAGAPKYTLRKLIRLAFDGVFDFSTFPLRLSSYLGFAIAIPSFALGLFFIVHRIVGFKVLGHSPTDTPGLASLATAIFFLGGLGLIMLGILGEYIGRIYYEVKRRPMYIVDETRTSRK
jgi:dolichol-phosphate mannosyltransferase